MLAIYTIVNTMAHDHLNLFVTMRYVTLIMQNDLIKFAMMLPLNTAAYWRGNYPCSCKIRYSCMPEDVGGDVKGTVTTFLMTGFSP